MVQHLGKDGQNLIYKSDWFDNTVELDLVGAEHRRLMLAAIVIQDKRRGVAEKYRYLLPLAQRVSKTRPPKNDFSASYQ